MAYLLRARRIMLARMYGFPFVVCVREHTRASILAAFERRLGHTAEGEVETALGEIGKIARLRLEEEIE